MVMNNNGIIKHQKDTTTTRNYYSSLSSCAASELKFLVPALLFICSLATVLQFLPLCSTGLRLCLSSPSLRLQPPPPPPPPPQHQQPLPTTTNTANNGVLKRQFHPYGSAAYNFIFMSAYRGGPSTFAVMGLSSKPLHLYGKPTYQCLWLPGPNHHHDDLPPISIVPAQKILPDWGYGRLYTVLVLNCTFPVAAAAGADGLGGRLLLRATTNDLALNTTDTILVHDETPQDFANFTAEFTAPRPKYDYLYCGSSLYGNLSPQRVREWLAYHVRLLGERSHFVIHDAGGVHEGVMQVLRPWMEKGFVTLQDIREQERFDGYYHNQFLIVNDCLHKYRFAAKWIFFFDVDEFIYVPNKSTINSVLDSLSDFTQFTIQQITMSNQFCLPQDAPAAYRKWGFEKLVYKDVKRGVRRDRKYAVQPRNVFATGVHMTQNMVGKTTYKTEGRIRYFHYHGTIAQRREPCRLFVNSSQTTLDGTPYVIDTTMRNIARSVKRFELKMIGSSLQGTRQ